MKVKAVFIFIFLPIKHNVVTFEFFNSYLRLSMRPQRQHPLKPALVKPINRTTDRGIDNERFKVRNLPTSTLKSEILTPTSEGGSVPEAKNLRLRDLSTNRCGELCIRLNEAIPTVLGRL